MSLYFHHRKRFIIIHSCAESQPGNEMFITEAEKADATWHGYTACFVTRRTVTRGSNDMHLICRYSGPMRSDCGRGFPVQHCRNPFFPSNSILFYPRFHSLRLHLSGFCFFPFKFFWNGLMIKLNFSHYKACLMNWNHETYRIEQFSKNVIK